MISDPGSPKHWILQSLLKLVELLVRLQTCGFPPTLYQIKSQPSPRDQFSYKFPVWFSLTVIPTKDRDLHGENEINV